MYSTNIKDAAKTNTDFRKVIHSGPHSQLVLMSIKPGEDIGEETHQRADQILFFVSGNGEAVVGDEHIRVHENDVVFVPAGAKHNFTATGQEPLKLFTVYSPPMHDENLVQATKADPELSVSPAAVGMPHGSSCCS